MNLTDGCCEAKNADGKQCWRKPDHYGPHLVAVEKAPGRWEWETWRNDGDR